MQLTTRRIIERLETVEVIETQCWDGSVLQRLTPVDAEQAQLLCVLAEVLQEVLRHGWPGLEAAPGGALPGTQRRALLPGPAP